MKRITRYALVAVLGLAMGTFTTPPAVAASGGDAAMEGTTETVLARRYPPPPVRRYRPPPRRGYHVRPAPVPRRAVVAPAPYRPFFYVGLGVHGTSMFEGDADGVGTGLGTGGGMDFTFGVRPDSSFAFEMTGYFSVHDAEGRLRGSAVLGALQFDARFFLTDWNQRLQPYILAGLGAYFLQREGFRDPMAGFGFQLGGGADFYLSRFVSIGGRLTYRGAYVETDPFMPFASAFLSGFTYGADIKIHF